MIYIYIWVSLFSEDSQFSFFFYHDHYQNIIINHVYHFPIQHLHLYTAHCSFQKILMFGTSTLIKRF